MIEKKRVGLIATSALILALGVPTISSAALTNGSEDYEVSISYADLDLSGDAGVVSLYSRLKNAANKVCGSTSLVEAGSIRRVTRSKACQDDFLSRAIAQIDNEMLSELHSS